MSVIVYGPGGEKLVEPRDLAGVLKGDWYLSRKDIPVGTPVETKKKVETPMEVKAQPLKQLNLDALSDDEVRLTAKNLSIPNWYNKGIEKLKGEIRAS